MSFIGVTHLAAQEAMSVSGGKATGNGGSVSYTLGQIDYQSQKNEQTGAITQGVQQSYLISVVTAKDGAKDNSIEISAYPNPVVDQLTLTIQNIETSSFVYQLYDNEGKLLQEQSIEGYRTSIDMSLRLPGTYYIRVIQKSIVLKIFKIIKE